MGKDTPRYFITAKGSHYWQPSTELRADGWKSKPLGKDRTAAVLEAIKLNEEVDAWVKAGKPALTEIVEDAGAPAPVEGQPDALPGSCALLFDTFQQTDKRYPTNKHTKRQYDKALRYLRKWLGPVPARKVTPGRAEKRYLLLAERTPAQAASLMRVARRAFGRSRFLFDPGHPCHIKINDNPFLQLDLKATQSEGRLWTRQERDAMVKAAFGNEAHYPSIGVAIELDWWLGQREGDILELGPRALEGDTLTIQQNKTRRRVHLPVAILPKIHALYARALELQKTRGVESLTHLLINEDTGQPWDEHAFRKAFRKVREAAEMPAELWFMHLRHTAVVEMEDSGCTIPEIAGVTGQSLQTVTQLLERYGRRTRIQAENAIKKRLAREESDGT